MDVFSLARHEYIQPPLPKHGRQSSNQAQQQQNQQGSSVVVSQGNQLGQQTSFNAGMFGNMNQSSSS